MRMVDLSQCCGSRGVCPTSQGPRPSSLPAPGIRGAHLCRPGIFPRVLPAYHIKSDKRQVLPKCRFISFAHFLTRAHRVQRGWVSAACFRARSISGEPLARLSFCKEGLLFLHFLKNIPAVREKLATRLRLCTLRPLERRSSRNSPGLQWPPAPAYSLCPLLRSLLGRSQTGRLNATTRHDRLGSNGRTHAKSLHSCVS